MLEYLTRSKVVIQMMFGHIYLSSCVTDLFVRFCTVPDIKNNRPDNYSSFRAEIVQHVINSLDHHNANDFFTE